jgi:hypothetical protein
LPDAIQDKFEYTDEFEADFVDDHKYEIDELSKEK